MLILDYSRPTFFLPAFAASKPPLLRVSNGIRVVNNIIFTSHYVECHLSAALFIQWTNLFSSI